jgi:hypothetical protein
MDESEQFLLSSVRGELSKQISVLQDKISEHLVLSEKRLSALEKGADSHERKCSAFQQAIYWGVGVIISVILAISGQLLLVSGRQQVVIQRQDAQAQRMMESDIRNQHLFDMLRIEIKEFKEDLRRHDSGTLPK